MRPIVKGSNPKHPDGTEIIFSEYARSRRYLIDRIGEYCSYCERKIEANLAVEHVQPKDPNPNLELEWSNFLLACTNCNSTKGKKVINLDDYFWPDIDNTFQFYDYDSSGIVNVARNLTDINIVQKVKNMLDLVGLQKSPPRIGSADWEKASDRRYEHRLQAWLDANHYLEQYRNAVSETKIIMLPLLKTIAINQGFWSIWMNVFADFPEVQIELINNFKGTNKAYFSALYPEM